MKTCNEEWIALSGLADAGSSKSLGKREVIKTKKEVVTKNDKKVKWKN